MSVAVGVVNALVKTLSRGARSVYSVSAFMASDKPISDTMPLNLRWELPTSSITCLAGERKKHHFRKKETPLHQTDFIIAYGIKSLFLYI